MRNGSIRLLCNCSENSIRRIFCLIFQKQIVQMKPIEIVQNFDEIFPGILHFSKFSLEFFPIDCNLLIKQTKSFNYTNTVQ